MTHKLTPIRVWSTVSHCEHASPDEAQLWCDLILELDCKGNESIILHKFLLDFTKPAHLLAVYARASAPCSGRIASLNHKVRYAGGLCMLV